MERVILDRGKNVAAGAIVRQHATSSDSYAIPPENYMSALAVRLFDCATVIGAQSINAPGGPLESGRAADFFTVDLDDPSIAGASPDNLLSNIVFSSSRTAVRDVVVGGKRIVEEGKHLQQADIVARFKALQKRLWD
jgi:formimidoylglutamate deiminase